MLAKNDIRLEATEKAIGYLAREGYEPEFGARPLKRVLQKEIVNTLSKYILAGKIDKNEKIIIDADSGGIVFKNEQVPTLN